MEFTKNEKPQVLRQNNLISAHAIGLYLKKNTFMSWKKMTEIWQHGYGRYVPGDRGYYGRFWTSGGYSSPTNFKTTIQYLVDHDLITFTKVNGFKCLAATKKLKSKKF